MVRRRCRPPPKPLASGPVPAVTGPAAGPERRTAAAIACNGTALPLWQPTERVADEAALRPPHSTMRHLPDTAGATGGARECGGAADVRGAGGRGRREGGATGKDGPAVEHVPATQEVVEEDRRAGVPSGSAPVVRRGRGRSRASAARSRGSCASCATAAGPAPSSVTSRAACSPLRILRSSGSRPPSGIGRNSGAPPDGSGRMRPASPRSIAAGALPASARASAAGRPRCSATENSVRDAVR